MSRSAREPESRPALPAPVVFVFTSGGGRAAAQVGMMESLTEAGVAPDALVGSSFGSINAAAYASVGLTQYARMSAELIKLWERIRTDSVFGSPGSALVRRFTVSRGSKATKEFREILATCIPNDDIADLASSFVASATDLNSGEATLLRDGPTLDAVLASSAIPLFVNPVERTSSLLVDGGFTDGAPLKAAMDLAPGSIVLLDAGASTVPPAELPDLRWWEVAATAYDHLIRGQLGLDLAAVAQKVPVLTLTTESGNVFDFSDPRGMVAAGREAARGLPGRLARVKGPGVYGVPMGFEAFPPILDLVRG